MAVISINGIPVAASVEVANTFGTRLRGLMFRRQLPPGGGMLLTPCSSIHMAFMRMNLDIVYLSQNYTVLAVEPDLKPWQVGRLVRGCRHVLELPSGQAALECITPGARLAIRVPMTGRRRLSKPPPATEAPAPAVH
jgi:uncharacterized membrane protein (UPF0127 family)